MKILNKKQYLIDLHIDCDRKLFKDPELYYYRLRMIEFIEKIDLDKKIILYHQNEYIHALRMKYFTNFGWRNKRYAKIQDKNLLRNKLKNTPIQLKLFEL